MNLITNIKSLGLVKCGNGKIEMPMKTAFLHFQSLRHMVLKLRIWYNHFFMCNTDGTINNILIYFIEKIEEICILVSVLFGHTNITFSCLI